MVGYIYILRCPLTNRVRYVGLTRSPIKRKSQHRCYNSTLDGNKGYKRWKENLKNIKLRPIFEVIEEINVDDVSDREIYWITFYKEHGFDLLNLTDGGEHNMISVNHNSVFLKGKKLEDYYGEERTKDIKQRTSVSLRGDKNPNYKGATCTEEWKKNQSKSQSKTPLLVYDDDILIGEFVNSKEVAKYLECSNSNIRESKRNGWLAKRRYKIVDKPILPS